MCKRKRERKKIVGRWDKRERLMDGPEGKKLKRGGGWIEEGERERDRKQKSKEREEALQGQLEMEECQKICKLRNLIHF